MQSSERTEEILKASRALFLRHGIRRVRIEEICSAAHVSKRTFYQRFRNKDDLAIHVLGELCEEARNRIEAVLASELVIEEKVEAIIATKSSLAAETSLDFYREISEDDSEPGRFLRQKQAEWTERVRQFYVEAQERGQLRADLDVDVLMLLLVKTRDMIKDPELQQVEPDFARLAESVMKVFFYGIVRPTASTDAKEERHD